MDNFALTPQEKRVIETMRASQDKTETDNARASRLMDSPAGNWTADDEQFILAQTNKALKSWEAER